MTSMFNVSCHRENIHVGSFLEILIPVPSVIFPSFFSPHFLVFQHYYHGPVLATTNSTVVLQEMTEIIEKLNNQTEQTPGHNETGHALVFLPESLVVCSRERPILCLLLMLGTLWLGYALYLIKRRYVNLLQHNHN